MALQTCCFSQFVDHIGLFPGKVGQVSSEVAASWDGVGTYFRRRQQEDCCGRRCIYRDFALFLVGAEERYDRRGKAGNAGPQLAYAVLGSLEGFSYEAQL